eukprot:gene3277-6487_t
MINTTASVKPASNGWFSLTIHDYNHESKSSISLVRWIVLILICLQMSGHALVARYSQGILHEKYSSMEVILVGEFIKLTVSSCIVVWGNEESDAVGNGVSKLIWLVMNSRKVLVLVIMYSITNRLEYFAIARVDASIFSVCQQLKTLTTAGFAVVILGRNISSTKWRAILLLVVGCVLVTSPTFNSQSSNNSQLHSLQGKKDSPTLSLSESTLGIGAVLLMVTISGFSSVYFESILKRNNEKITIWERNVQLAFYSVIVLVIMISYDFVCSMAALEPKRIFSNWSIFAVLNALFQAAGGLLVAATLKYADAILKTFSTAGSIMISTLLGHVLLGGVLDIFVVLGSISTILAVFNYTLDTSIGLNT